MKRKLIPITIIVLAGFGIFLSTTSSRSDVNPADQLGADVISSNVPEIMPITPEAEPEPEPAFKEITLTSLQPGAELTALVGLENTFTTLAINRIDDKHLMQGMTLVMPTSFEDPSLWEFMPENVDSAKEIPKLAIISQHTQAFGFYEYGKLVRSGPVSSGKESTPTKSGLYFTNWKGEEVISTFSDEWILKWNFNIDNDEGISLHEYALPGYPASHSCVRFYEDDAKWFYDWADQWILAWDGNTKLANGTPVVIFGTYEFNQESPWKRLLTNSDATRVSEEDLVGIMNGYRDEILLSMKEREGTIFGY